MAKKSKGLMVVGIVAIVGLIGVGVFAGLTKGFKDMNMSWAKKATFEYVNCIPDETVESDVRTIKEGDAKATYADKLGNLPYYQSAVDSNLAINIRYCASLGEKFELPSVFEWTRDHAADLTYTSNVTLTSASIAISAVSVTENNVTSQRMNVYIPFSINLLEAGKAASDIKISYKLSGYDSSISFAVIKAAEASSSTSSTSSAVRG